MKNDQMTLCCRDTGEKIQVKISDVKDYVVKLLDTIQKRMFDKANAGLNGMKKEASDFKTFYELLCNKNILLTPHCNETECEDKVLEKVKEEAKILIEKSGGEDDKDKFAASAKTLCIPLEQLPIKPDEKCFFCGKNAKKRVLWGKSY